MIRSGPPKKVDHLHKDTCLKITCCACFHFQGFYLPCFFLPGSFNFIFSKFLQSSTAEFVLNSESEFSLVVGIDILFHPDNMTLRGWLGIRHQVSIYFERWRNCVSFMLVLKRQTETVNGTSISYLYLPFFTRAIPKGLTFGLCL